MPAPAVVWIVVGSLSVLAVAAVLIGLVRHVLLLSRTLGRFQREVGILAEEVAGEAARAAERTASATERLPRSRSTGAPG